MKDEEAHENEEAHEDVDWGAELIAMEQTLRRMRRWWDGLDTDAVDEVPPLVNKRLRNIEIARLVADGNTVRSVAERYEVSLTTIYTIVRDLGGTLPRADGSVPPRRAANGGYA